MSRYIKNKNDLPVYSRPGAGWSIRDELGSVSPFSGKVRKKPTILMITEDLRLADEVALQADKLALVVLIYWSFENMLTGYNPACDVLIIDEKLEQNLSNPSFSRILKKLINVPTVVVNSHEDSNRILSPFYFVHKRLQQSYEQHDIVNEALEAYHQFHDHEAHQTDVKNLQPS